MPYKTALTFTYDCGEFEGNMQTAAGLADLDSFPARREAAKQRGKLRGIGLCNCIEVAGGPFLRPAKDMSTLRLGLGGAGVGYRIQPDRRGTVRRADVSGAL